MSTKILAALVLAALFLSASPMEARQSNAGKKVEIPGNAKRLSDTLYDLGSAKDRNGDEVQGYAIIHRHKAEGKTVGFSHRGSKNNCYTFIARGIKWRTVEPWVANTSNTRGLDSASVFNVLAGGVAKWEDAADGTVNGVAGADILGSGTATSDILAADLSSPDGLNEVYFADVSDAGAIAVTIVWYNRFTKSFEEWDQVYDDVDYNWSLEGVLGKMDFDNIATHELGHSAGLGDLYNSCVEETMYGYADFGETKKRDLNSGDIAGVNALY